MTNVVMIRSHYPDVRLEKEAKTLVDNSYTVTLVVWDRGRSRAFVKTEKYMVKRMKIWTPPGSIKVIFYLPVWWTFIIFNLIFMRWDVVHASDFDTFVPALIVAKIKRKPIIYDIFDFYADMIMFPIAPKIFKNIIAKLDRYLMKFADAIIIPDDSRKKQIGTNVIKHAIIIANSPNEAVLNDITIREKKQDDIFTIFFAGGISKDRCIDKVCLAVKDLSNVQLIIMGPSSQEYQRELREICRHTENIKLVLEWVPYKDVIRQTMNADLLFCLYDPKNPNNRYSSPNKLFEAMMCEKPIIVSHGTSVDDIVKRENCGLIVPYGDVNAIKEAIITLRDAPQLRKLLGENGRKAYKEKYSWNIMESRLISLYHNILRKQMGR